MPKDELTKHTLRLYAGEFEELCAYYAPQGLTGETVIRTLIRVHLEKIRQGKAVTLKKNEVNL